MSNERRKQKSFRTLWVFWYAIIFPVRTLLWCFCMHSWFSLHSNIPKHYTESITTQRWMAVYIQLLISNCIGNIIEMVFTKLILSLHADNVRRMVLAFPESIYYSWNQYKIPGTLPVLRRNKLCNGFVRWYQMTLWECLEHRTLNCVVPANLILVYSINPKYFKRILGLTVNWQLFFYECKNSRTKTKCKYTNQG